MTEITFNQSPADAAVKVLIATKEEALNYGVAGGIVSRALFNQLKALVERERTLPATKRKFWFLTP